MVMSPVYIYEFLKKRHIFGKAPSFGKRAKLWENVYRNAQSF
jgi:hypothetical protein